MANIQNLTEAWAGHSGLEVETFLKGQLAALSAALGGKFGYVAFNSQTMTITFYDEPGGTALGTVQLGGQVYTVTVACNLSQVFYVLADETTKMMTITPSTTVAAFGSSQQEPFPESYTYTVAVNSGEGYRDRVSGSIATGGSATFDIKPFLATGDNYIRVTVTGTSSGQAKTTVFTGTLTTLTMTCNHTWQNVWTQGLDYVVTGIRFSGNLIKELHVSVDNVEVPNSPVVYSANQSYTTTATTFTIPASAFPAETSGVHSIKLWMSAQGVSTQVVSYNIMCVVAGDTTPMVCINAIQDRVYNFTAGTIFSYAVYNANKVSIDMSATLNSVNYIVATGVEANDREAGVQYAFAYSLEVDTGANETKIGSLGISVMAYQDSAEGITATASTIFDNTYSYIATPGYLFYLNAATRDNGTANHEVIVNEAGASTNFAATYNAVWSGLSWYNDAWSTDQSGYKALCIPAGCSVTVTDLKPLNLMSSYSGMTIEFMLQCGSPSDYSAPVFSLVSGGATPLGILIYPTKITVWGSAERDEDFQTVNFSENAMTHICVTLLKGYGGNTGKNIVSVYINGISNICFSFDGSSNFGDGPLVIGQANTDAYLYKMRIYGTALEPGAVLNNFLNCIVEGVEFSRQELVAENNVLLGSVVDYDLVKRAGFNTMVVTTPNNEAIPSFFNQVAIDGCTVRFEYAGSPTKNATVSNVSMDGQGTTSKKYYRWNLRWKTSGSTNWTYGDGTSVTGSAEGRIINDTNYVTVDRITAKKNIASSPQGHKMGLTGLYNDLFHQVGLNSEMPVSTSRVAVYQFPFVGFHYNTQNQSYEYIGIYTAGPDKGSKVTFGYGSSYTRLLSLEGPNHAPRGTRFLCPWVDVDYSSTDETLTFGGEEGWDCDYVGGGYKSDKAEHAAAILSLYNDEWRPAYNCVYDNSPYLASYSEVIAGLNNPNITTLADLLTAGNAATVKAGTTNGMIVKNEFIAFYDSSYDLYYYRRSTAKFEKLPNDYTGYKNAKTDLTSYLSAIGASTSSPTTAQLIQARGARFKATVGNYFSVNQTLYHYCFCLLYGVTDNFAKNSYPFKFQGLSTTGAGNRWGWRQDDLDSVLMTDNNGSNTKSYSVEHLDTFDGVQIFQGGDSALWMLIKANYEDECRTMMINIANAATAIATSMGIAGSGLHESLFNLTSYYCWEHSSKYFPATIYEADRSYAYIEPWLLAGKTIPGTGNTYPDTYNGVKPLSQALGDQYQGEKLWVERRIAYIFSKFHMGAFHGTNTGYNAIVFTLAEAFTFRLTPAIDLYPVVSLVDDDEVGDRTQAGSYDDLTISTSGDSNNSIHGGDWLASLGDLSRMRLSSRGGSTAIPFSITGARLQTLKIGDATAGNVRFNATSFGVVSPTITYIDARNTATILNIVDLLGCPRLRTCLFAGSGASGLYLPVGAKLTEVSFPEAADTVFMHSLPFLTLSNLTLPALANIVNFYINNCPNINPFTIVSSILGTTGNALAYVTMYWGSVASGTIEVIKAISNLTGRVVFESGTPSVEAGMPIVEGTVQIPSMYSDDYDYLRIVSEETYQTTLKKALSRLFNTNFYVIYDPDTVYIRFLDALVESICTTNWGSNGTINFAQAAAVTSIGTNFNAKAITSFDEFKYFTGVTKLSSGTATSGGAFYGCTSLVKISLPSSVNEFQGRYTFGNCSALEEISINRAFTSNTYSFQGCTKVTKVHIKDESTYLNCVFSAGTSWPLAVSTASSRGLYKDGNLLSHFVIPEGITTIRTRIFDNNNTLTELTIPNSLTSAANYAFNSCSALARINITSLEAFLKISWGTTSGYPFVSRSAGGRLYLNDVEVTSIVVPSSVTELKAYALYRFVGITSITPHNSITAIGANALSATKITELTIPASVTTIGDQAFSYTNLTSLTIPATVTTCGENLLTGCSHLVDFYDYRSGAALGDLARTSAVGVGTGTFYVDKNFSMNGTTGQGAYFKRYIFNGNLTATYNSAFNFGSSTLGVTMEEYRIRGNANYSAVSGTNYYSILQANNNAIPSSVKGKLKFIEILGSITATRPFMQNLDIVTTGCIMHFGYNGVATTPSIACASYARVTKIYVGTGESEAGDQAVLDLYLADSAWSSYSSKLDLWYNYDGEYKNNS